MKKYLFLLSVMTMLPGLAMASMYHADCLNPKGKFSDCTVLITGERLKINFDSNRHMASNVDVPGNKITALSAGEYSRRRVAEAVLLTPWILFSKKKRDQIGVEYLDSDNKSHAIMIQVKKKYGLALETELKALSGQPIQASEADTKKK